MIGGDSPQEDVAVQSNTEIDGGRLEWLESGDAAFGAMLLAIEAAETSVRLETYTFAASPLGSRFLEALRQARRRGLSVRVLIDALGSWDLPTAFWTPLTEAGGQCRWFNPLSFWRLGFRDHRKLLVCDERIGFVGGFNIAPEYEGDGVSRGWRDLGLRVEGGLARELARSFDQMFEHAEFRWRRTARFRKPIYRSRVETADGQLLQSGPGRALNLIRHSLQQDIQRAGSVQIMAAYFLPPWRFRRALQRLARRGGKVQLLLPGISDVRLSQLASHQIYDRLLSAGIEIYEYQPQVLHAKLSIVDDLVYVGSANLDVRSLRINYELSLRLRNPSLADQARELFGDALGHSRRVELDVWRRSRSFWARLQERWAYFLLVRLDPYLARQQWRQLW
jgi:cardiolipin synthase